MRSEVSQERMGLLWLVMPIFSQLHTPILFTVVMRKYGSEVKFIALSRKLQVHPRSRAAKRARQNCTWFINFTFDREKDNYFVKNCCLERNHGLNFNSSTVSGGFEEITLDANLEDKERESINSLSFFSLPLFNIY